MPETTAAADPAAPAAPGVRQRPATRFPSCWRANLPWSPEPTPVSARRSRSALAASGADVVVNYIVDPAAADDVAHQIEAGGRRAITIKADVSNEDDVRAMFASAIDISGPSTSR